MSYESDQLGGGGTHVSEVRGSRFEVGAGAGEVRFMNSCQL
jgi:hypothetical protein